MTKPQNEISDDEVRQEILRGALPLYLKHGPGKVTMDDVANASGRSRTSLYYYYKNHGEIYQAVLTTMSRDSTDRIREAVIAAHSLEDKLFAFCMAKLKTYESWKEIHKKMWLALNSEEQTKHSKTMKVLHAELMQQENMIIREVLSEARKRVDIRPLKATDRDMFAFILSTGIRGIRNEILDLQDAHDMTAAVRMLTDMLVKWLRK
jgi:AcrR family transcriptional regulator